MMPLFPSEQAFMVALLKRLGRRPDMRVARQNAGKIVYIDPHTQERRSIVLMPTGAADVTGIAAPDGLRLEIECKHTGSDKQEPAQVAWQAMIERHGGVYVLVHGNMGLDGAVSAILAAIVERRSTRDQAGSGALSPEGDTHALCQPSDLFASVPRRRRRSSYAAKPTEA